MSETSTSQSSVIEHQPNAIASHPPVLHPFQCTVCLRRFTRNENLKRHAHRHRKPDEEVKYSCTRCPKVFARSDLRRRHIRKQHPEYPLSPITKNGSIPRNCSDLNNGIVPLSSSSISVNSQYGCDNQQPQYEYQQNPFSFDLAHLDNPISSARHDTLSLDGGTSDRFPAMKTNSSGGSGNGNGNSNSNSNGVKSNHIQPSFDIETLLTSRLSEATANAAISSVILGGLSPDFTYDRRPSTIGPRTSPPTSFNSEIVISQSSLENGISLYFENMAGFFPFIHQPTFDVSTIPEYLLMAMLSVSLQFLKIDTEEADSLDDHGGDTQQKGEYNQSYRYKLTKYCFYKSCRLLDDVEQNQDDSKGGLKLHMIQAYLLLEVHALFFSRGSESFWGLRFHHRLTELARVGGLGDAYPPQPVDKGDLEALWRQFIKAESHKRTLYAAYHLDTLWYHTLSIPRGISHLEIKLDLPCPESAWNVNSAAEWAFYGLMNEQMQNPIRYLNAIRLCLSPDASEKVSTFDTYGCLALILYLLSGVREMSGWSTVTGKVPIERFETLYASLVAFESIVRKEDDASPLFILMKATWHMAMIDLLLWSPSHTNGVVEINLEAALAAVARLSNSAITFSSSSVAEAVDQHLNWFLNYLNKTKDENEIHKESPWLAIYSFKAVLIAYQQVSSGNKDPLKFLGLKDVILDTQEGLCIDSNVEEDSKMMSDWIIKIFKRRSSWSVGKIILDSLSELDHND